MERLLSGVTARYAALPAGPDIGHQAAPRTALEPRLPRSATLAFADAFRAIMLAFIVVTFLVPLLRNVAAPKTAGSGGH